MISIVIVNHNTKDLLKKSLNSAIEQDTGDAEIIVVDNGSADDSASMVSSLYSEVKLIQNAENMLFCKAQNQGIGQARGEFILCLNSDCVLEKDYLKEALKIMSIDSRIGMVSGKILRSDKKTIDSTGLFLGRNRKAIERGYGKKDKGQYDEPGYVFGVTGACAFFRKDMLEDIKDANGYFDERFGMYFEDLDLCWRARKKGWKAYYNPKAVAYHERGGTAIGNNAKKGHNFPRLSDELKKRYIRNRHLCMKKNDSMLGMLMNFPFILLYEIKMLAYQALTLHFCNAKV
ncbi:MAG: glycosyltransferase family 2 protein [Candidatus Omnitrophica bacterium]|nr:glycosyltransferase family 2 protein [Candidatus Omnitrophota bacterium]